jgi:trimeric autotransporter adhesin
MATLTGTKIANTYKQLLQVGSSNTGLTGTVQAVQDGGGNASPLELSQNAVNINGTFQLSGVTLTANASTLNAVADLTGATGMIAVSGGSVYGRTITGGAGVSISNADGTEGNPTIALNTTGVVSASYGPATNIEVNAVGQIVSAGAATSVSVSGVTANTFTGGTFAGTTGDFSSNVSVGGNLVIAGQFSPASLSVTGTINANKISTTDATFNNIVSAGFFVGDGSGLINVPSAEGGTVKAITAGTGIKLTVDAAVTTTIPVSGTVAVSANQNFGTVSVSTALAVTGSALFGIVSATTIDTDELLIAGVSAATVNEVAAVSALTQTNLDSITSINIVVANVSALTSVNLAAITSINAVLDSVSAATSVNSAAITSINVVVANVSALTSVNAAAITSINTVTDNLATSIGNSNTNIATVSALTSVNLAAITSINVVVANVSALTSVNAAAITSINAVIEGNVSADSGTFNTLTVVTSASVGGTFNVGGNVGIGTSSPSGILDLSAETGLAPLILFLQLMLPMQEIRLHFLQQVVQIQTKKWLTLSHYSHLTAVVRVTSKQDILLLVRLVQNVCASPARVMSVLVLRHHQLFSTLTITLRLGRVF